LGSGDINCHMDVWKPLTDAIVESIAKKGEGVVFMLWGYFARQKQPLIEAAMEERANLPNDQPVHLILACQHPCADDSDFDGCQHFQQAREYQEKIGKKPTNWQLSTDANVQCINSQSEHVAWSRREDPLEIEEFRDLYILKKKGKMWVKRLKKRFKKRLVRSQCRRHGKSRRASNKKTLIQYLP